jgi:hypothetical protein
VTDDPGPYLVAHLTELLATDPRVSQPGLEVVAEPNRLILRGAVPSRAQREGALEVVREQAGDLPVECALEVLEDEPADVDAPERLQ